MVPSNDRPKPTYCDTRWAAGGGVAIGIIEVFSIEAAFPLVAIPLQRRLWSCWARQRRGQRSRARLSAATFHPPAGIDPLVVVVNGMSCSFLIVPVGLGAVLLALFAFAWHNLAAQEANRGDTWPTRWW
jgi:hypothetical protein